jgi:hypothetical protein
MQAGSDLSGGLGLPSLGDRKLGDRNLEYLVKGLGHFKGLIEELFRAYWLFP